MFDYIFKRRLFFLKSETDRLLTLSMLFSIMLVAASVLYSGKPLFLFLIWNLFLGYIPYAVSNWLMQHPEWIEKKWRFSAVLLVWILFIPNSFYIVTDIFHLRETYWVPLWLDLIVLVSFAWNGLLLGFISIRHMEKIMETKLFNGTILKFTFPVIWLNALGVYIGRYLRYNSWDFLTNPFALFRDIVSLIIHPVENVYAWGMIFCFAFFMFVVYTVLKKIGNMIA